MIGEQASFDIVIATRNRQGVLPIALGTMLSQSLLPQRLIVADSSDRHAEVRELVLSLADRLAPSVDTQVVHSDPGIPRQRNAGTAFVTSPVVFYPDDDVLWFPGVAEAIMRIYSKDPEAAIGCVTARDASEPPPGTFEAAPRPYKTALRDRVSSRIFPRIRPVQLRLFPEPLHPGKFWVRTWGARVPPAWLHEEDAELCGPISGYRMTFRTDVIRGIGGFDERLMGLGNYACYEDSDATLGSFNRKLNVIARRARVFHYREPSARAKGRDFGAMEVLNGAYVICKHSPPGSAARKHFRRYLYCRLCQFLLQANTRYGRDRFLGAVSAFARVRPLMKASPEDLPARYLDAQKALLRSDCAKENEGHDFSRSNV